MTEPGTATSRTTSEARTYAHVFHVVLVLQLSLLAVQPLLSGTESGARLTRVFYSAIFLGAVWAVRHRRRLLVCGIALAGPAVLLTVFSAELRGSWTVLAEVWAIASCSFLVAVFLAQVYSHRVVTSATVSGALCVYLLLGLLWSFIYTLIETVQPGSFTGLPSSESTGLDGPLLLEAKSHALYYFSYVTLTTLGYGDITPTTGASAQLAILQAVVGQLFLVVLVARLVGLQIAGASQARD